MRVDFDVAMEVAAHEALVRQTYKDGAGVLTWCVGMTNATGHRVERYIGKPQPLQHCMQLFVWALTSYAGQVREAFKDRPLTQAQFAAAVSFHWNTGAIKQASWVRYWLRGDDDRARTAFMNWVTPKEIAKRRAKERDLFFDGRWSHDGTMLEFTKVRPSMAPDWSSGRRINVADELRLAFADKPTAILDQAPEPDAVPAAPTLTPDDTSPAPIPTPRPEPEKEATMPKDDLSPIDQMNKPIRGTQVGTGTMTIGGAIAILLATADFLPEAWSTGAGAVAFGVLTGWLTTTIGNFIGSYMARDKRFQSAE